MAKKKQALNSVTPAQANAPVVVVGKNGLAHSTTLNRLLSGQAQLDLTSILDTSRTVWGPDGRYSTQEVQAMIIEGVAQGLSAPAVLSSLQEGQGGKWPSPHTLYGWRRQYPSFGRAYKEAQAARGEALAEAAVEVAMATDGPNSGADALRVKTLQWMAARVAPNEFGEKTTVEHQHTVKQLSDEEIDRRLAELNRDPDLKDFIDAIVEDGTGSPGATEKNQ